MVTSCNEEDRGRPADSVAVDDSGSKHMSTMIAPKLNKLLFAAAQTREWFTPLPGERIVLRIRNNDTGGAFSMTEIVVAPLAGPPLHFHRDADEVFMFWKESLTIRERRNFRTGPGGLGAPLPALRQPRTEGAGPDHDG